MLTDPRVWRELFGAVYEINSARTHGDFAASVVAGLERLIVADVVVLQLFDRAKRRLMTRMNPSDSFTRDEVSYYTAHPNEFPLVEYYERTGDTQAKRLSDLVDLQSWTGTKYYLNCLARQGLRYCLALPVVVDRTTIAALSFNRRETDFSDHDCALLDAFAPHFRLAWQRHDNPWADQRQLTAQTRLQRLGLSPRESEVLFWMAEGKQNREIAAILGIRLGTAQEYVANILDKLGQENRSAATVFAIGALRNH